MDAATGSGTLYCAECGRPSTADELARFGNLLICSSCKDNYAQKLREGAAPTGALAYAGFWIRFVGWLIDAIIMGVVGAIIQTAILGSVFVLPRPQPGSIASIGPLLGMIGLVSLINLAMAACYEGFFVAQMAATPGKMVIGAKVVRGDGSKVGLGRAFARYFAKILSSLTLLIGFIIAGFDSQKRALHDMICDTRVIKARN